MNYYQLRVAYKEALDELSLLWSAMPGTAEDCQRRLVALKVQKLEAALWPAV